MEKFVDFKSAKKQLQKRLEAEIDAEIKRQDWYIEAKQNLRYRVGYLKIMLFINMILLVTALCVSNF